MIQPERTFTVTEWLPRSRWKLCRWRMENLPGGVARERGWRWAAARAAAPSVYAGVRVIALIEGHAPQSC
ncbi:hypothetical protein GCM10010505_42070 [Kitasatospora aburaviensis]